MSNRQSVIVLVLLAALHGAATVLFAPRNVIDSDTLRGCLAFAAVGAILTTPAILAFWAVR